MTLSPALRRSIALGLMVGLGWLVATDDTPQATAVVAAARPRTTTAAQPDSAKRDARIVRDLVPREQLLSQRTPTTTAVDLFASRSWEAPVSPPPPSPASAAAPPAPARPAPAPFVYLGKRLDEQGWQVFLGRGEAALIVREGETLEGGYRVESIRPPILTLVRMEPEGKEQIAIGSWE